MTHPVIEAELIPPLVGHFRNRGFRVFGEVPFFLRRVDVLCISALGAEIVAVEAKMRKWQEALHQARQCLTCADFVYVALAIQHAHRAPRRPFKELGIGILSVDGHVEEVLPARRSPYRCAAHARRIRETALRHDFLERGDVR